MKKDFKIATSLFVVFILSLVVLYGTEYYFNKKEIDLLTSGCYEAGGTPVLETSSLLQGYSFSCEVEQTDE